MSEEILINVTPRETRVAMVENGVLNEIFIERASRRGLVGRSTWNKRRAFDNSSFGGCTLPGLYAGGRTHRRVAKN
jgi:hypothetical protein